ncbi:hypothetical protein [Vogesella sp. XCS3]|uniref:hypothetical protein n=1 Tax=Vogesella sp. XCS3 TaxID=2877939 RepID=UPI001D0AE51D|nr:hypothetical protein [Vogesella sp. XCS3]UDM18949.1 hypothetical protein LCH97_18060 [Vogesella sp. XCS3]
MKKEFPNFPLLEEDVIRLLQVIGFVRDDSWHNEICPSFLSDSGEWKLMVDHPVRSCREFNCNDRFSLYQLEDDQIISHEPILSAENVEDFSTKFSAWRDTKKIQDKVVKPRRSGFLPDGP